MTQQSTVYVETTIPSYLTSRPSRDLVVAAHQQLTHDWWRRASHLFDLFLSEVVLEEIRAGDSELAHQRRKVVEDLPILTLNAEGRRLADVYRQRLGLHAGASVDLLHIAIAVAHELDYLVTWNCKHIANGQVIQRLLKVNDELGVRTPVILTPEELFGMPSGDQK